VEVVRRWWWAFADRPGGFIEELIFRVVLAFDVLTGRVPRQVERRWWNRSTETPALVDVYDWTTDRLIFSVLVWASLESSPHDADYVFRQRVYEVKDAIAKGAADKAWSTCWEVDYGLRWDHERQVWTDSEGFAYDGSKFGVGSRTGGG
jgi:hypothetical protein